MKKWRDRTVLLLAILLLAACTFERRPELAGEEDVNGDDSRPNGAALVSADPIGSAIETLAVFREAVALGDLSLALALLDRDVILLDRLVEVEGRSADELTRGELLLELRRIHGEGLELQVLETDVTLLDGAALVITRLALLRRTEGTGLAREVARADETALLTLTPEGWRVRHLHRSMIPRSSDSQ